MKDSFISFLIVVFFSSVTNAQDKNMVIRTGLGYYMDTFTAEDGPIFWIEGGYKFKTGFNLNCRLSMSSMEWKIREGLYKDYKTFELRQMIDIYFSKSISLVGNHFIEPGIGFKLKRDNFLRPEATFIENSGNYIIYTSYSKIFYEIGFTINLDYYYQFSSGFFMGLRADTNLIWALGFEGLTLSPLFGFRF